MSLLRVATFYAARELARYVDTHPDMSPSEAVRFLRLGPADVAGLNYTGGVALLGLCGQAAFLDWTIEDRLAIITRVMDHEAPAWIAAAPRGRQWVREATDADTAQCLGIAGLWDPEPTEVILAWWQDMAARVRAADDYLKSQVGSEGERLTLQFERERLTQMGRPDLQPVWRSLEDNSLGYDIESYDLDASGQLHSLRIEAKATRHPNFRFFLTRNEWEASQRFGSRYRVDVWDLASRTPMMLDHTALGGFVPTDKPQSRWQQLLITAR